MLEKIIGVSDCIDNISTELSCEERLQHLFETEIHSSIEDGKDGGLRAIYIHNS